MNPIWNSIVNRAGIAVFASAAFVWAQSTPQTVSPSAPPSTTQVQEPQKKPKDRSLHWGPPLIDSPLRARILSPPCTLSMALERAAEQANEMVANLQNFTAQERVDYQRFDRLGYPEDSSSGNFEYIVDFQQQPGGMAVRENRNPSRNSRLFEMVSQDVGLPAMALMFLPAIQSDYAMRCEATTMWEGQPTWVVRFQQRQDRPSHTLSFRGGNAAYQAKLKGRAWIASDSGEVVHIDTTLMEQIPAAHVRHWYLSVDYAPVQFQTRKVTVWLPQTVDTYSEFDDHRAIAYHTFSNFMLFSVQTHQTIDKPQQP